MAYIPKIELGSVNEINRYQEKKLKRLLEYLEKKSVYYKRVFRENNVKIAHIRKLSDIQELPFTDKEDLQKFNNDFLCVKRSKIADFMTTSGTSGLPVMVALTDNDLERLAYNEYISFICAGGTKKDIYQLMTTMDKCFMAGLAYFMGIRKLGAGIVRVGNGLPAMQWDIINRFCPSVLVAVPSFILKLIDYAEENGIDFRNTSVKSAVCIGEALRNQDFTLNTLGQRINDKWQLKLYSTYASTEMSAAFTECTECKGGHHHPELLIVEFLDEKNRPVCEGEPGEVTITTIGTEAMPLLRYKTGDICAHYSDKCNCGRTTLRLGPIIGRKNQMIKYKGTTLYPPALFDILNKFATVENYLVEVFKNEINTDEIRIHIGTKYANPDLENQIREHCRAKLRVTPIFKFETPEIISKLQCSETNRKAILFKDSR